MKQHDAKVVAPQFQLQVGLGRLLRMRVLVALVSWQEFVFFMEVDRPAAGGGPCLGGQD